MAHARTGRGAPRSAWLRRAGDRAGSRRRLDARVVRGPFAGLHYPRRRGDIVHAAKLLGAYECELHAALERLVARAPSRVVNVGSGDGFYVAGLARRLPAAEVWAVDPDPLAQRACHNTAARNAVEGRVHHVARLDAPGLDRALRVRQVATPRRRLAHTVSRSWTAKGTRTICSIRRSHRPSRTPTSSWRRTISPAPA